MAPAHYAHHSLPANPTTAHAGSSRSGTPAGVSRDVLRHLQDVVWSDEEDDPDCLLCAEPLDLSDLNFKPCQCGLQICQFCYNKLLTTDARCPGCRRPYDQQAVEFQPVEFEAIKRVKATKQQRAKINKQLEALGRRHLREVRIVMKNMVYVVGMKLPAPGDEAIPILRSNDYFGQYGKISKLSIRRPPPDAPPGAQTGIYITYVRREDAQRAILALDGIPAPMNPGQTLKASHGTTRYCDSFLRGVKCDNPSGCTGLHEWGGEGDTFTKEDLAAAFIKTKDPVPGPPKVISIPAMQKSAWPKPSAEEPIDSSNLPRTSSWGMRPAPAVIPTTTRRAGKKHVLNLVPLGRPVNSYAPPPAPTPTKEKKAPIIIRTNSGIGMSRGRSGSSSTVSTPLEMSTASLQEPEPEPEPLAAAEPEPQPVPERIPSPEPQVPEPIALESQTASISASPSPPASEPSQTPPPLVDPAIASSSFTAPIPSSVQFPNYPIHSPYPEFDDVFAQHTDTSLAFSFGFDDDELERQIASGSFEPFAPFGAVLDGLPALGISGAVSALLAVQPLGDEKSYAGVFDPFADDMDETEAARKASRFGFARRPSSTGASLSPASAPVPPPQEVKWSATDPRIQQLQMHLQRGVSPSPESLGPPPGLGRRDPSPFQDPAIAMMRPPPPMDPHSAQAHSTARMLQHLQQMRSPSPSQGSYAVPPFRPKPIADSDHRSPSLATFLPSTGLNEFNDYELDLTTRNELKELLKPQPIQARPAPQPTPAVQSAATPNVVHRPIFTPPVQAPPGLSAQSGFPPLAPSASVSPAPEVTSARVPKIIKEKRQKVKEPSPPDVEAPEDLFSIPAVTVPAVVKSEVDVPAPGPVEEKAPDTEVADGKPTLSAAPSSVPEGPAPEAARSEVISETPSRVASPAIRAPKVLRIPSISATSTPLRSMTPRPSATSTPVPSRPASPALSLANFPALGTPAITQVSMSFDAPSAASSVTGTPTQDQDKKKRKKGGTKVKPPEPQVAAPVIGEQPAFAPRKKEKAFKPPVIKPPKTPKAQETEPSDAEEVPASTEAVSPKNVDHSKDSDKEGQEQEVDDEYEEDFGCPQNVPFSMAKLFVDIQQAVGLQQYPTFVAPFLPDGAIPLPSDFRTPALDTMQAAISRLYQDCAGLDGPEQIESLSTLVKEMSLICREQAASFPGAPAMPTSPKDARRIRNAQNTCNPETLMAEYGKLEAHQRSTTQYAVDQMLSLSEFSQDKRDDWNSLQNDDKSVRELERAQLAARQDLSACQLEFSLAHREMADVVFSAASLFRGGSSAVGGP